MAVRNCLECQQAQFKHGTEGSARSYTAMPSTMIGTSKSASAQASTPITSSHQYLTHFLHFLCCLKGPVCKIYKGGYWQHLAEIEYNINFQVVQLSFPLIHAALLAAVKANQCLRQVSPHLPVLQETQKQ